MNRKSFSVEILSVSVSCFSGKAGAIGAVALCVGAFDDHTSKGCQFMISSLSQCRCFIYTGDMLIMNVQCKNACVCLPECV